MIWLAPELYGDELLNMTSFQEILLLTVGSYAFLQGFFIFLSFATTGKALELYKSKFFKILRKQAPQNNEERMGNLNPREQFIYRRAENQETNITQVWQCRWFKSVFKFFTCETVTQKQIRQYSGKKSKTELKI